MEKEKRRENKRLKRLNQPRAGGGIYTQLLRPDRSDRSVLQQPAVQPRSTAELLSSTRSLCCDAATSTKFRSAVLEGPRNPGRWPVLRKPPNTSHGKIPASTPWP